MFKLTGHLFCWDPSSATADFYERALYNHILASQEQPAQDCDLPRPDCVIG